MTSFKHSGTIGLMLCLWLEIAGAQETPTTWTGPITEAFALPVGEGTGEGYEIIREAFDQFPGETWDGVGGGNTDFGNPVSSIGAGVVIFAEDAGAAWGNMVIIRHAYRVDRDSELLFVDSIYAYLLDSFVRVGDEVQLGEKIGAIGKSKDDVDNAKLYFAIRKKLNSKLNSNDSGELRDHYHIPSDFLARFLPTRGKG